MSKSTTIRADQFQYNAFITVRSFLSDGPFANCDTYMPPAALDNRITSPTVMDVPDIGPWLHKGQAVLIARVITTCMNAEFIQLLAEKQIACLITQQKFKKYITEEHRAMLTERNIPVIFVSDTTSWSDVIVELQRKIMQSQNRYIVENTRFQSDVINYLADPSASNNLCAVIYKVIKLSIAFAGSDLRITDSAGNSSDWDSLPELTRGDLINYAPIGENFGGVTMSAYHYLKPDDESGRQYLIIPSMQLRLSPSFYLILREPVHSAILTPQLISRLEIILSIYALRNSMRLQQKKSNLYFRTVVLQDLLNLREEDTERRNSISYSLGFPLQDRYSVLYINNYQHPTLFRSPDTLAGFTDYLAHIGLASIEERLFMHSDGWVLLFDRAITQNPADFALRLNTALTRYFNNQHFTIGIGHENTYWTLEQSLRQAMFAVGYMHSTGTTGVLQYSKIGIVKLFTNQDGFINQVYIDELFHSLMFPLLQYDRSHGSELYFTLETFFSNNMSYKVTSHMLNIHVNTLRARLAKIEEILSTDLSNLDNVLSLRMVTLLNQFGYFADQLKQLD